MDDATSQSGKEDCPRRILRRRPVIVAALFAASASLVVGTLFLSQPVELTPSELHEAVELASLSAKTKATGILAPQMDEVFAPVYAAIPVYADYHYSLAGEYTALAALAVEGLERDVDEHLFAGFDDRLESALERIDATFESAFSKHLAAAAEQTAGVPASAMGPLTSAAIADTTARMQVTLPVAGIAASGAAAAGGRAAAMTVSRGLASMAARAGVKAASRQGGMLAGAAAGGAVGTFIGPAGTVLGGLVGGLVGGIGTWVATDYAIIEIDEMMHRDAFEAELEALVDTHRIELSERLAESIGQRSAAIRSGSTIGEVRSGAAAG